MRITQNEDNMTLEKYQYLKNITSIFEISLKHPFKGKQPPLPTNFILFKKDIPITEVQTKEIQSIFRNLNYRSVIGALLYVSCCTQPDITYAVNELAKFSHRLGIINFRT